MKQILRELRGRQGEMVKLLGEFVRCESPSHVKSAVDRVRRAGGAGMEEARGERADFAAARSAGITCVRKFGMGRGARAGRSWCWGIWTRCIRWGRLRRCRFAWREGARGGRERSI